MASLSERAFWLVAPSSIYRASREHYRQEVTMVPGHLVLTQHLVIRLVLSLVLVLASPGSGATDKESPQAFFVGINPRIYLLDVESGGAETALAPRKTPTRGMETPDAERHHEAEARAQRAAATLDAERRAIFEFHAQDAGGLFADSRWILEVDRFGFLPSSNFLNAPANAGPELRGRSFLLIGRLRSIDTSGEAVAELHGEHVGPSGSLFTLDGFVRNESGERVLDAVYAISAHGAHQTGRVRLRLETRRPPSPASDELATALPQEVGEVWNSEETRQALNEELLYETLMRDARTWTKHQERLLWEGGNDRWFRDLVQRHQFEPPFSAPDPFLYIDDEQDLIQGVPVPSWFDLTLSGMLENNIRFEKIDATLVVSAPRQPGQAVSVLLTSKHFLEDVPGTMIFDTSMANSEEGSWGVEAHDGSIELAFRASPSSAAPSFLWTTQHHGAPATALAERVDGNLSIAQGSQITGDFTATGYHGLDATRRSRYTAKIDGERRRKTIVTEVLQHIGLLPLTGEWRTDSDELGTIMLEAEGRTRDGEFAGDASGRIDGEMIGTLLRFHWADADGRDGWGFMRALSGTGHAVGLWGSAADRSDAFAFTGVQPGYPAADLDLSDLTDHKLQQLSDLGRDLARQGKCTQALALLDILWNASADRPPESEEERLEYDAEHKVFGRLLQKVAIIEPMLECSLDLGDYSRTLDYLRKALELQHDLNPLTRARHNFSSRIARSAAEIRDQAETVAILVKNLGGMRKPKIGVTVDIKALHQPLIITAVSSGGPAAEAGLQVGDKIVAIDGQETGPLEMDKALAVLGGEEVAPVTLTVISPAGARARDIILTRAPWHLGVEDAERRSEIEGALNTLRASAGAIHSNMLTLADEMERADLPAEATADDITDAFQRVLNLIEDASAELPQSIEQLRALGESLFADWDNYLPTQRFLFSGLADLLGGITGERAPVPDAVRPDSVDQAKPLGVVEDEMMAQLAADPTVGGVEVGVFYEHFKTLAQTIGLFSQLQIESLNVRRAQAQAQYADSDIAEHARSIARFSNWLERWRERLALDDTRIAALELGADFARDWVSTLWELEPHTECDDIVGCVSIVEDGSVGMLLAAEAVRNRAQQDLLSARQSIPKGDRRAVSASFEHQPPLEIDDLVELVSARGGTSVVYYSLADRLLTWVLDAERLSCDCCRCRQVPATGPMSSTAVESRGSVLDRLGIVPHRDLACKDTVERCVCNGLTSRALDVSADDIRAFAEAFQDFAARKRIGSKDGSDEAFAELLHKLHQRLIAPIADLLPRDPDTTLTIVPDGELFQIPFGALITSPTDDLGDLHYLIEDHPLAYLTSLGMIRFTRENAREAAAADTAEYVTFWNPEPIGYSGLDAFLWKKPELRAQIPSILQQRFPADSPHKIFSGTDATQKNLFSTAPRARLLSLVAHAKAARSESDADDTFIALAGRPLTLRDIYGLDLDAEMVVLAACETGRGRIGSDGVIGLSRAFTVAGAPTLAMTLWQVPIEETIRLLDRFYAAYLGEGLSKPQALRQAQMAALAGFGRKPQAHLWAGMVLFGEP
jgi:CHAT domain-containing protein